MVEHLQPNLTRKVDINELNGLDGGDGHLNGDNDSGGGGCFRLQQKYLESWDWAEEITYKRSLL